MSLDILLFGVLSVLAIAWLVLVHWLARRLRKRHPLLHEEYGSFGLFENNTVGTTWLMMKFIYSSRPAETRDVALVQVCLAMRILFVVYMVLFPLLVSAFFIDFFELSARG